jgi:SAM-dependent methyltransferase
MAFEELTPEWRKLIADDGQWRWRGTKLFHPEALETPIPERSRSYLRRFMVSQLYATQNSSRPVRQALADLVGKLGPGDWGLNLGAGGTRIHPRLLNLDLYETDNMDIVTRGHRLPFRDNTLKLVVSQEVVEHLAEPAMAVAEVHRVLQPGGWFYCQVPFIIGYHPGPNDYWRFTKEGLAQMFASSGWAVRGGGISLGHGSGFYRIAVEYVAVNFSLVHERLYLPAKALAAVLLLPVKLPDLWSHRSAQQDRIPGGYYYIVQKSDAGLSV